MTSLDSLTSRVAALERLAAAQAAAPRAAASVIPECVALGILDEDLVPDGNATFTIQEGGPPGEAATNRSPTVYSWVECETLEAGTRIVAVLANRRWYSLGPCESCP